MRTLRGTLSAFRVAQLVDIAGMVPPTFADAWSQVAAVAAGWPCLTAAQQRKVRAAHYGIRGLVELTRCATTGTDVGIYDKSSGLLDIGSPECRYAVICEEHGGLVMVESLRVARLTARDIRGVCEVCYEVPDKVKP